MKFFRRRQVSGLDPEYDSVLSPRMAEWVGSERVLYQTVTGQLFGISCKGSKAMLKWRDEYDSPHKWETENPSEANLYQVSFRLAGFENGELANDCPSPLVAMTHALQPPISATKVSVATAIVQKLFKAGQAVASLEQFLGSRDHIVILRTIARATVAEARQFLPRKDWMDVAREAYPDAESGYEAMERIHKRIKEAGG